MQQPLVPPSTISARIEVDSRVVGMSFVADEACDKATYPVVKTINGALGKPACQPEMWK